jgi:NADH dehydrogenase
MNDATHTIVIVGGGFAGTTLARALDARRTPGLQVTLISDESTTTFNPMLPEAVGASVFPEQVVAPLREMLDFKHGDRFVMGRATDVDTRTRTLRCETLAGARELRYDQLVLAFGNRARLDLIPGMALHVEPDLSVPDHPGLWALGDCALVPNAHDGRPSPPTAQFAVRQAKQLARNLLAHRRGAPTRPFSARPRGMMAAIGRHNGVAEVFGVGFSGLPAWLLWRAYYLSQMPTLRRRLRIWVEWTWGMFFPADITHLRFTRSAELPVQERGIGV